MIFTIRVLEKKNSVELMCYYDKVANRNQNPKKIKMRSIFLYLLNKEPPTMTHKDLQQSRVTSMA